MTKEIVDKVLAGNVTGEKVVYCAGPMRGYEDLNFPAFDAAKRVVEDAGYFAVSPADIDRLRGLEVEDIHDIPTDVFEACMAIDLPIVAYAHAILLLKGWERSLGANNELFVAQACGVEVWEATYWVDDEIAGWRVAPELTPSLLFNPQKYNNETICQEADRLVSTDRQGIYGPPHLDFARTAAMWAGYMGVEFAPEDVAMMMVLLKVSRLKQSPGHRDSVVDIAGYAKTMSLVQEARATGELV